MPRYPLLFVFLCAIVLSAGDLKISSRNTSAGGATSITNYWKGDRSRSEIHFENARQKYDRITIDQCDLHRMIRIDPEKREYAVVKIQSPPRGWTGYKPADGKPGSTVALNIDGRDTGERKEIFGRTARHIITTQKRTAMPADQPNYEQVSDGWYIDLQLPSTSCFPQPSHAAVGLVTVNENVEKFDIHRTGVVDRGYPVWERHTWSGLPSSDKASTTREVTEISEQPLDSALFEIPAGFKEVDRLAGESPPPLTMVLQRRWERFKETLAQWF